MGPRSADYRIYRREVTVPRMLLPPACKLRRAGSRTHRTQRQHFGIIKVARLGIFSARSFCAPVVDFEDAKNIRGDRLQRSELADHVADRIAF